jgi:ectoine hydroxylase-related dioxygenase (phytanoyl-CoA dioxygenase family)
LRRAVCARFDRCLAALQIREAKGDGVRFKEIMQRDALRFDCQLPVDASAEGLEGSASWRAVAEDGPWLPVVRRILCGDCNLYRCGVVVSLPGAGAQYWHLDGEHHGRTAGWEDRTKPEVAAAHPHAVCVFVPLVDLTLDNGYTEFWAGSQHYNTLLEKQGVQTLPGGTHALLSTGDALLYDFRTIHRGMPNNSTAPRPIFYVMYSHKNWKEQRNWADASVFAECP